MMAELNSELEVSSYVFIMTGRILFAEKMRLSTKKIRDWENYCSNILLSILLKLLRYTVYIEI